MIYTSIQQRQLAANAMGSEVERINRQAPDPYWYEGGTQPYIQPPQNSARNFLLTSGLLLAGGFVPLGNGRRGWDKYHWLAKHIEERSPRGILRTFGVSQLLQTGIRHPLKDVRIGLEIPLKAAKYTPAAYAEQFRYYQALTGKNLSGYSDLIFRQGKLFGVQPGTAAEELLLEHASLFRKKQGTLASSYVNQFDLGSEFTSSKNIIIGGKTKLQHARRLAGAYATDTLQKLNQLAKDPFLGMFSEFDNMRGIGAIPKFWDKARAWKPLGGLGVGFKPFDFTVRAGPAHKMGGRMAGKFATRFGLGVALYTGTSFLTESLFDKTPTQLAMGGYVAARKTRAAIGDAIGAVEYTKRKEAAAPSSTSLLALASVPLSFSLTGGAVAWGRRFFSKNAEIATWAAKTDSSILPAFLHKYAKYAPDSVSSFLTKGRTMAKAFGLRGAMIGTLLVAPFVPRAAIGILFGDKSYEELDDIYSGREEVAIRKGRWWEFGRTPYRGDRVSYYRPHAYHLMQTRARERAIWGEERQSWLEKFYLKNFTYYLEQKHYEDRPYPVSSPAFADFPIPGIRSLLMAAGRIVKPPVYMHQPEWISGGAPGQSGVTYRGVPTSASHEPGVYGLEPVAPQDPHSWRQILAEEKYKTTELIGLRGFVSESIQDKLTGTKNLYQGPVMEDAGRIGSARRGYWDAELGGLMGTTEFIRRFLPVERVKPWERYNPIENKMPDWLPGSEYYIDFQHGDPYTKLPQGEVRLPGRGYEILHPEVLKEGYTDFHRFKILADVAPYSAQYKSYARRIRAQIKRGDLEESRAEEALKTLDRVQERKKRREFDEGPSEEQGLLDNYWRWLSHRAADNPVEYLIPFAPVHKFIGRANALEQYEREVLHGGSRIALWTRPVEHFAKPAMYSLARNLGIDFVPEEIQHRRQVEEYFDKIEYIKYKRLEQTAVSDGDYKTAKLFAKKAGETMFGLNVYSRNIGAIFRALPSRERDFYEVFVEETDEDKREKILNMVPEEVAELYKAQWEIRDAEREKRGIVYSDRRNKEHDLSEFFSETGLPDRDWIGWDPRVDLEDVKLKYVQHLGEDMHDYNLWESREAQLARKPHAALAAQGLIEAKPITYRDARERLRWMLGRQGRLELDESSNWDAPVGRIDVHVTNDRARLFDNMVRKGELVA